MQRHGIIQIGLDGEGGQAEEQAEHKDDDGLRGLVREDLRDLGLLRDLRGVVFLILLEHFFKVFLLP